MLSTIEVSYLTRIFDIDGEPRLHQGEITAWRSYEDFPSFAADFIATYTYPRPQASKYETYSFAPTLFEEGWSRERANKPARWGHWRLAEHAAPVVTLLALDLDNAHDDRPHVSPEDADAVLREHGLAYLLYTSFTDGPAKRKFRVILPISREMTYAEAASGFEAFNALLGGQLDAAVTDPGDHLYCIPHVSDVRLEAVGRPVDVDSMLAAYPPLPDGLRPSRRRHTDAERTRVRSLSGDLSVRPEITLSNPVVCRPEWRAAHGMKAKGGSRSQTMMSTLTKVWLRSGGLLTAGEMSALFDELDTEYGGYVGKHYGRAEAERMISSVMSTPVSPPTKEQRIANELTRLRARKHA